MKEYENYLVDLKLENDRLTKEVIQLQKEIDKLTNNNNKLIYQLQEVLAKYSANRPCKSSCNSYYNYGVIYCPCRTFYFIIHSILQYT